MKSIHSRKTELHKQITSEILNIIKQPKQSINKLTNLRPTYRNNDSNT